MRKGTAMPGHLLFTVLGHSSARNVWLQEAWGCQVAQVVSSTHKATRWLLPAGSERTCSVPQGDGSCTQWNRICPAHERTL